MNSFFRIWLALLAGSASLIGAASADGEDLTLAGRWKAGPLVVKWRVGEWGKACGPQPSGGGDAGGTVMISEAGSELTITGVGRTYSTAQCWQQFPGLNRTGHSASKRSWTNTCKAATNDPRQTTLRTRISATDSSISFEETGQYQFVIQGQNCTASSGHWRTYTLLQRAGEPAAVAGAPSATPATEDKPPEPRVRRELGGSPSGKERCQSPGAPARLEIRPARKLMKAGENFQFRALVLDANGCAAPARPEWTLLTPNPHATLSPAGELAIGADASEGELEIRVQVGGTEVEVLAEIASQERYDALLSGGDFNASGEVEEAATAAIASAAIGAAPAVAKDGSDQRKQLFIFLVGAIALVLGTGGILVLGRTRRAHRLQVEAQENAHQQAMVEHEAAVRKAEEQRARLEERRLAEATQKQMICPVCGAIFAPGTKFCGTDGTVLLPVN